MYSIQQLGELRQQFLERYLKNPIKGYFTRYLVTLFSFLIIIAALLSFIYYSEARSDINIVKVLEGSSVHLHSKIIRTELK